VRWLALYLRSRQVAAGAGVALACVAGLGLLPDGAPGKRLALSVFAVMVVTAVTGAGLAGQDPALERTGALDWRLRRTAHVVAIGGLAALLGVLLGPDVPAGVVVRNAVGLTGLAALGATLLGGGLAWCVPMTWTVAAVSALMVSATPGAPAVTWPVQPPDTTTATLAAGAVGLVGLVVYGLRGPRVA
jgi:hypothetical protein